MWILTKEINEYNQEGEYFVSCYSKKPTFAQLKNTLPLLDHEEIHHILDNGGGRINNNPAWYFLFEWTEGVRY